MAKQQKQLEEAHGLRKLLKILLIIIFIIIGVSLITLGAICIAKNYDKVENTSYRWLSIINVVFGCLLFTSPFFLNQKRSGLNWIIKILMTIIFILIGILLIVFNSLAIAKGWIDPKWIAIVDLVFGCLLFTSPIMLKK